MSSVLTKSEITSSCTSSSMGMAKKTMDLDHAGPFLGKIFLVIIDSYSKWLEVVPVSSADTLQTVTVLRRVFSTHGIPEMIVSDNGAAFTSSEFEEFTKCKSQGQILHSSIFSLILNLRSEREDG